MIALCIALLGATAPGGRADEFRSPCDPALHFDYRVDEAIADFALSRECTSVPGAGDIRVNLTVQRCDLDCKPFRRIATCRGTAHCRARLVVPHDPIEMADYTIRVSYQSTGRKLFGGFHTERASCYSIAVTASC